MRTSLTADAVSSSFFVIAVINTLGVAFRYLLRGSTSRAFLNRASFLPSGDSVSNGMTSGDYSLHGQDPLHLCPSQFTVRFDPQGNYSYTLVVS